MSRARVVPPRPDRRAALALALLLAAALCCRVPEAVFSPDGERLAFVQRDGEGPVRVQLVELSDGTARQVFQASAEQHLVRPIYGEQGGLWLLVTRRDAEGWDVYAVEDDGVRRVASRDGGSSSVNAADFGLLLPACVIDGRWLWTTPLGEGQGEGAQRLDLATGAVDAPFDARLLVRSVGVLGEYALVLSEAQAEPGPGAESAAESGGGPDGAGADDDVPPRVELARCDLAAVTLAPLVTLDADWSSGPGREPAVLAGVAVGRSRLAVVEESPQDGWTALDAATRPPRDHKGGEDGSGETHGAPGGDAPRKTKGAPSGEPPAPRWAELVLMDGDGQRVGRHELQGVRLVGDHALTGPDRWWWGLVVQADGRLALRREDLRSGQRVSLPLGPGPAGDDDGLFLQARLSVSPDGARVALALLGEDVGCAGGGVLLFDGARGGPLEPVARYGDVR